MNLSTYIKTYYPALLILLVLLGFSLFAYNEARVSRQERRARLFEQRVQRASETVNNRMIDYIQILKGCQGLFNASDSVTANDWRIYTATLNVSEHYPGIQALAYSRYINKTYLLDLERNIQKQGFPSFKIRTTSKSGTLTPVIYIQPLNYRNTRALGFDLLSNPIRKEAINRAIMSGEATLTKKIELAQEISENKQPGLLMFLPIYKNIESATPNAGSKRKLIGLVSNVFRAHDLMNELLKRFHELDIEIYDGENFQPENILYDSNSYLQAQTKENKGNNLSTDTTLLIAGTRWKIFINTNQNFDSVIDNFQPNIILSVGILLSSLIFILAVNSIQRRFDVTNQLALSKAIESKKDEFIGIASHELKTPLTSIKAYIQLLERTDLQEKERNYVKKASSQIKKLSGLISDLLDVSKIQAGKLQLNIAPFSLKDFIDDSAESVEHMYNSHRIIKPDEIPDIQIMGDKFRLEQALTNFLVNAIKYSPDADKVYIYAKVSKYDVTIEVSDTGIGISKENQERIFDRFFRAEELLPSLSGLGIGLYISHELIKRHNGQIGVRSELGKGATFFLSLPRGEDSGGL